MSDSLICFSLHVTILENYGRQEIKCQPIFTKVLANCSYWPQILQVLEELIQHARLNKYLRAPVGYWHPICMKKIHGLRAIQAIQASMVNKTDYTQQKGWPFSLGGYSKEPVLCCLVSGDILYTRVVEIGASECHWMFVTTN